ncbi:MAG: class I SAM-dependent methyltransferase [Anaerolineales bacterium]|nr:MAG: class I SAM-dependent methyltransferase [Anaerolineales bacterium]
MTNTHNTKPPKLEMLERSEYLILSETDPLIFYFLPFFGPLYRGRVELALGECTGGKRILEIGYGSGLTFLNLAKQYDEIHGVELFADQKSVEELWKKHGVQTYLKQGDLLDLPYEDGYFDTVLLISTLEHIKPSDQTVAMAEFHRILKPGGQLVYGVPVERPLMQLAFRVLGYDIREHHLSTEKNVADAARAQFKQTALKQLKGPVPFTGAIYEVGNFKKEG